MRLIGHSDQRGRPDGVQVMVHRGFAYVGHMFSKGWSVIDVCDPKRPRAVNYVPAPPGIWNIHLQTHDDLLLVVHAKDTFAAAEFADERSYYRGQLGQIVGTAQGRGAARDWRRVFDIADPFRPLEVGALVPAAPTRLMDHRPNRARVIQSADVYVDAAGLIYSTDYNAGLSIMEFGG